jgi:hypothetical protein
LAAIIVLLCLCDFFLLVFAKLGTLREVFKLIYRIFNVKFGEWWSAVDC